MKLFAGLIAITFAIAIASVAGFFSITGLAALFAASFWPIIAMGSVLESGKIVAVAWLHTNWHNPRVSVLHKGYLTIAILALMLITAIGIYGYLAKGHLDQTVPLGIIDLQITQREQQITTDRETIQRLNQRQTQLDAAVNSLIEQKFVLRSQSLRNQQKLEREQIAAAMLVAQRDIDGINRELLPLKIKTNDAEAKLGPVKYVADLFGWTKPDTAVRMVILVIMAAFDPLAMVLVLSGCISLREWVEQHPKQPIVEPSDEKPLSTPFHRQPIPPVVIRRVNGTESDKQAILAMLQRNPGAAEEMLDTVLEWHQQHR